MTKLFRFKQFELRQDRAAHKMGTDAMLLGAWARFPDAMNILDIGTGTGVLALMMAQKHEEAIVDAVEIDSKSAEEATFNFEQSPWSYRLSVYAEGIQQFCADETLHYDLIVCNPPFFEPVNKSKGNNDQHGSLEREQARQTKSLSFDNLLENVQKVLVKFGQFYTVLPIQEATRFTTLAEMHGLALIRRMSVYDREGTAAIRQLLCFSKQAENLIEEELAIYNDQREWTTAYKLLTADFHLHPDF